MDVLEGVCPEVARREVPEVRLEFLLRELRRQLFTHLLLELGQALFLRLGVVSAVGHAPASPAVKSLQQGVLELVPQVVAGPQRVGKRQQGEHGQVFLVLHRFGKLADDRG